MTKLRERSTASSSSSSPSYRHSSSQARRAMPSFHQIALFVSVLVSSSLLVVVPVTANNPNGETPWALHNNNIQSRVQQYMKDPDATAQEHGAIRDWDLRNVTSLRNLFSFNERFNEDISRWNVSAVTDFSSMFWDASRFDRNLGSWDVSKAETMACMFCGARKFKGEGLEQWSDKLHNVKDMFNMFGGSDIQADLRDWEVYSVTNFRETFKDTPNYKQKLCWNVTPVAHAVDMFNGSGACFKDDCVLYEISVEAGCSAAWSPLVMSSLWLVAASLVVSFCLA
ncbi:(Lipo)protein [Seminavis robusta]|uniref:(Lipo)protein n=1 Tax=Seminavis robusta TaxID=568900 RepID=A0A9N8DSD0_9STRA|nr:(Lipo)protein [Seminavis robusta]|eukprot:Sro247_g098140.1 (Lipo)protein (283) ;mRNA; r:56101-56949